MKSVETTTKSASPSEAGLFATLRAFLHVQNSGVSSQGRFVFLLSALAPVLSGLAFAVAPAFAAGPPEMPVTSAPGKPSSTSAVLQGVVNPLSLASVSWFFDYKAGGVCTGGSSTTVEGPAEVETMPAAATVEDLTPDTKYTVCLVAENAGKEQTVGAPVAFTTAPEAPETLAASAPTVTGATLNGVLSPNASAADEAGSYEFLYRQSASECAGARSAPDPAGTANGAAKEAVSTVLAGLAPGTAYTFCLLHRNDAGETAIGSPVTFMTTGPGITEEQASSVEATEATLQADIDPNESETSYHFEYDTVPYTSSAAHGTSITEHGSEPVDIGSGTTPEHVEVRLMGLRPDTTYYYRVVALDTIETFDGPTKTIATPPAASTEMAQNCPNEQLRAEQPFGLTLPDCRAYEMVSPTDTNGQDATDSFVNTFPRAAVSGEAITYASEGAFGELPGATIESQYLSRREPGGWTTQGISPPRDPNHGETKSSYDATSFTPELTAGIAATNAALTGEGPPGEFRLYLATFGTGTYQYIAEEDDPLGASRDLSHVVSGENSGLREWDDGIVTPVSVANNNAFMSAITGAATDNPVDNENDSWNAVSANGSRVYFTSPGSESSGVGALYVRVNAEQPQGGEQCEASNGACTVAVSASQRATPDPHSPQPARYWGASANGSKVLFTSKAELTNDAYTGPDDNAANLYEYELSSEPGKTPGRLTDLTVDHNGDGAEVLGVAQISEEGLYVYLVAKAALAAGATAGAPNLYVIHDGGAPTLVATLDPGDEPVWHGLPEEGESGPLSNTAVVTSSGTRMAFVSERSLTGYDNQQATSGDCESEKDREVHASEVGQCDEVYLYDAEAGTLDCASCNRTGARPVGPATLGRVPRYAFDEYRPRNLLEDGTLLFDSSDALVPHASDGRQNVYEYDNGRVQAISDVAGGYESFFLDASADGRDVFFGTADRLLPQATSSNVVVYDARIDGGFPVAASAPSCDNADSCKPPESPQPGAFGAPASATFSGPGDIVPPAAGPIAAAKKTAGELKAEKLAKALKQCKKVKRKGRRKSCEASVRKRYRVTSAAKSTDREGNK